MECLRHIRAPRRQVERRTAQLDKVQQQSTLVIHEELSSDLVSIMDSAAEEIQKLPDTTFKKMFWDQQVLTYNVTSNTIFYNTFNQYCTCMTHIFYYILHCMDISTAPQRKAMQVNGPKGMRWHPLMIKWCVYLKSLSAAAYVTLTDVLRLPSTRTLRDYTHWMSAEPGYILHIGNVMLI